LRSIPAQQPERLDDLARNSLGVRAIAGIIGGLSTAHLRFGHFDNAAGPFKQLDRRKTDRGAKQIDQAGDEEADAKRPGLDAHPMVL